VKDSVADSVNNHGACLRATLAVLPPAVAATELQKPICRKARTPADRARTDRRSAGSHRNGHHNEGTRRNSFSSNTKCHWVDAMITLLSHGSHIVRRTSLSVVCLALVDDRREDSSRQDRRQVLLRRLDGHDVELVDQHVQHGRGDEGRKVGTEPHVLDAQVQQRQQDGHGLLLEPT
jgi:hypothetical protein